MVSIYDRKAYALDDIRRKLDNDYSTVEQGDLGELNKLYNEVSSIQSDFELIADEARELVDDIDRRIEDIREMEDY